MAWRENRKSEQHFYPEKKSGYILKLSQKFDFQPSTTKPDKKDHLTVETGKI
jgi:hypothetical protein